MQDYRGPSEDPLEIENSNLEIDSSLDDTESDRDVDMSTNQQDIAVTIPGILLLKRNEQWNLSNQYLKSVFIDVDFSSDSIDSINGYVNLINNSIYRYFNDIYGTVNSDVEQVLVQKYNTYSVHSLKKALK